MQRPALHILSLLIPVVLLTCSASEPQSQPPEALRVMSFNIRYGAADDGEDSWRYRKEKTARVIWEHAPDIISMQEVLDFQRSELLEMLPRYDAFGAGRDDGIAAGEQCCILYDKARFTLTAGGTFWLSKEPGVPGSVSWDSSMTRICTWARLYEPEAQRGFYVFNAHFDHIGAEARLESAELTLSRIELRDEDEPVIFVGDLNCGEGSAPVLRLSAWMADSYRAVHPKETLVGTFNGFKGTADGEKIDYVFVDDGWDVMDAVIIRDSYDGNYPSDHFPVAATLQLKE